MGLWGKSLNQTVIDLLGRGLGAQGGRSNWAGSLGWKLERGRAPRFERATAPFEGVDEELWR